jgi:hypothetical protein
VPEIDITLALLALAAFFAGLLDAMVGGGGLIQLPAVLIAYPIESLPILFGTNKIAGFSGTSVAAWQYLRKVRLNWAIVAFVGALAFLGSWLGANTLSRLDPRLLKPIVLFLLIGMAVYTAMRKNLGATSQIPISATKRWIAGGLLGLGIGFYDGFFGPGTGSFLVMGFVVLLGEDFLTASAYAKVVNMLTNIGALFVFIGNGQFLLEAAVVLAAFNVLGSLVGSKLAIRKGNSFVRKVFLVVISLMIVRYGWELIQP